MEPAAPFPFGPFTVRPDLNRLEGPAGAVPLEPRVMEVLVYLFRRQGEVVSKEELVREIWDGRFVSDDVVWRSIGELRRALGDDARPPRLLQTVPKRGYRLLPPAAPEPVRPPSLWRRRLLAGALGLAGLAAGWYAVDRARATAPLPTPATPEIRDALLQGKYLLQRGTPETLAQSLAPFERAAALAGRAADRRSEAAAWAGLADARHLLVLQRETAPRTGYPLAEAAARRALALDPGLGETHATLGSILFRYHWDWPAADRELRRAVAAAPGSALVHHDYSWFLVALGRFEEGLAAMRRAQEIDPLSLRANADVGWVLYRIRRTGEAIAAMRRLLAVEPGFGMARQCLEHALRHAGRPAEALEEARIGLRRAGLDAAEISALTAGPPAEAWQRLNRWRLARRLSQSGSSPYDLAALYADLGEPDPAFAALERAFAERDPALPSLAVDPVFDRLHGDPRFAALLARLRLPSLPAAAGA